MNKDAEPKSTVPLEELRRVVKLMKDNDLSVFVFENEGFRIKLERGAAQAVQAGVPPPAAAAPAAAPASAAAPSAPTPAPAPVGEEITSPMVGTFYRSPAPDAPPFVSEGDTVKPGQTVCIIEAMKVMNEIKAEKGGVIAALLVEDASPVQFGQGLFRLK